MAVRQTSLAAYRQITDLSGRRKMVYLALKTLIFATDFEIAELLRLPINEVTPRRLELYKMGLIEQSCKKKNKSGRLALVWRVKRL